MSTHVRSSLSMIVQAFALTFSFVWNIQHIVPLCFMLSWVYPVAMLVQRIVYEKEQRLKEVLNYILKMNSSLIFNWT